MKKFPLQEIKQYMFKKLECFDLPRDIIGELSRNWALLSAGNSESFNMMTVSWGSFGFIWGSPALTVFVRPQRFTMSFMEKSQNFALSFFPPEFKESLALCGSKSGRNIDKLAQSKLNAWFTPSGTPAFKEAKLVIEAQKIYQQDIDLKSFIDESLPAKWYPGGDFHKAFTGRICGIWTKD